jgi:hypothetical protein
MSYRILVSRGLLTIVSAVMLLIPVLVAAQGPVAASKTTPAANAWTPPRTPDGQPDLQGFWTNATYTPLERAKDVAKEFYTEEEVAEIVRRAAERESDQTVPGTIPDVHYDFTQFGLDKHQSTYVSSLRTSLIVDPPDGRIPPMTAEGQGREAERKEARSRRGGPYDAAENLPLTARCLIMWGAGPPMLSGAYNNNYQIVQAPGYVMILVELNHDVRIIPLEKSPHPPQSIRQWMGSSRGRWEGDTLVVETTNFNGKNPFRGASENLRVTERFRRVDADTILYRFTVEDPSTWARPWSAEAFMRQTVGPIFESACHEGNYGITNILAGARAEDKRAAEEAAKKGSK